MKIELILRKLEAKEANNFQKIKLRIKLGNVIHFNSSQQTPTNNIYPFLQKNTVLLQSSLIDYISIEIISNQSIIAHKTLFLSQAVKNSKIVINEGSKHSFKLFYDLNIMYQPQQQIHSDQQSRFLPIKIKRSKSIAQQPEHLATQQGKLQILKMGVLVYNFAQRLDPLIKFLGQIRSLFQWKSPTYTIILGLILTFFVIYPKLSLGLFSLLLIFGRHYIIQWLSDYQVKEDISKRLLLPQQNLVFLQNNMQKYCDMFEKVNTFLRSEDRTMIITLVQVVCKMGILLLILQLIFSFETLVVFGIWTALIIFSPIRKSLFESIKPKIIQINDYIDHWIRKINGSPAGWIFRGKDSQVVEIIKQFYIYEHQRWWVGKQWVSTHWSDQNRQISILARRDAPNGWNWIEDWHIQYSKDTDKQGYEYSHDLLKEYTSSKALKTLRRRKWRRKCMKKVELQKNKLT